MLISRLIIWRVDKQRKTTQKTKKSDFQATRSLFLQNSAVSPRGCRDKPFLPVTQLLTSVRFFASYPKRSSVHTAPAALHLVDHIQAEGTCGSSWCWGRPGRSPRSDCTQFEFKLSGWLVLVAVMLTWIFARLDWVVRDTRRSYMKISLLATTE